MPVIELSELFRRVTLPGGGEEALPRGLRVNRPFDIAQLVQILIHPRCPQGLTIDFMGNDPSADTIRQICNALETGLCAQDLRLTFHACTLGYARGSVEAIAGAIRTARYPQGLLIDLTNNHIWSVQEIAAALMSPNPLGEIRRPQGLGISLGGNNLDLEAIRTFGRALRSRFCPENLKLRITFREAGIQGVQAVTDALASGECAPGLELDLNDAQIGPDGIQSIANAIATGLCPPNLMLNISEMVYPSFTRVHVQSIVDALLSPRIHIPIQLRIITGYADINRIINETILRINSGGVGIPPPLPSPRSPSPPPFPLPPQPSPDVAPIELPKCSACLDELDPRDPRPVYLPPCGHRIHNECRERWRQAEFGKSRGLTCPICRRPI